MVRIAFKLFMYWFINYSKEGHYLFSSGKLSQFNKVETLVLKVMPLCIDKAFSNLNAKKNHVLYNKIIFS